MTNPHVAVALVEALIFLEFSDDEVVDPDAAVQTMKTIASILAAMSSAERDEFIRHLVVLAEAQPATEPGQRRSEYIREIPGYLGLA